MYPARSAGDDLSRLLVLNLVLQVFDGVATYQGLRLGWREANPLLLFAIEALGVVPALVLFKVKACGLLVFLRKAAPRPIAVAALQVLALVHCLLSLAPWLGKFLAFAVTLT